MTRIDYEKLAIPKSGRKNKTAGPKKRSIKTIKRSLWEWFSRYVRLRDSDQSGYGKCISCSKILWVWRFEDGMVKWNHNSHAGHYYSRGASKSLYYDEKNVNLQCSQCNTFKGGANQLYAIGLVEKYTTDILQELYVKHANAVRRGHFELEALEAEYKDKAKRLMKERGI
jgi:hypothetical protein